MKLLTAFFLLCLIQCPKNELTGPSVAKSPEFDSYWNQGKAEINVYELQQARYGEMRPGEAVLIFVPEEFSKEKQVKLDNVAIPLDQKISVLKMNMTKSFATGIYPYSMMMSSYVSLGGVAPWQAVKVAASSQEWCGQVYSQLNRKSDHYQYQVHSYFESEGEINKKLDRFMTEDALWNLIRINPESLIQSDSITIIPSLLYARLSHKELKPYRAITKKIELDEGNKLYQINYPELNRTLFIEYQAAFPHTIVKWSEEYIDGFGDRAKELITTAVLKKQVLTDYWTKNKVADDFWRDSLNWRMPVAVDSTGPDTELLK